MDETYVKLNVFSLNCWGIPYVSKNRPDRIIAIAEHLQMSDYNIVCLQEIWSEQDYNYIKGKIRGNLPYSHYFYSGVLGSGLCVFSKWLIEDVFFHQWPLNGYVHMIHHADWFGGKGVGLCQIKYKSWSIYVYCTHLHAEYNTDDIYLAHRVLQAYQTAQFVKLTSNDADIVILAGDLNTEPGKLTFRLITEVPGLKDPFNENPDSENPLIARASGTSDHITNTYSNLNSVSLYPEGKRIDHILYNTSDFVDSRVSEFGNPLEPRIPGKGFSYSDHNAVTLEMYCKKGKMNAWDEQKYIINKYDNTLQLYHKLQKTIHDIGCQDKPPDVMPKEQQNLEEAPGESSEASPKTNVEVKFSLTKLKTPEVTPKTSEKSVKRDVISSESIESKRSIGQDSVRSKKSSGQDSISSKKSSDQDSMRSKKSSDQVSVKSKTDTISMSSKKSIGKDSVRTNSSSGKHGKNKISRNLSSSGKQETESIKSNVSNGSSNKAINEEQSKEKTSNSSLSECSHSCDCIKPCVCHDDENIKDSIKSDANVAPKDNEDLRDEKEINTSGSDFYTSDERTNGEEFIKNIRKGAAEKEKRKNKKIGATTSLIKGKVIVKQKVNFSPKHSIQSNTIRIHQDNKRKRHSCLDTSTDDDVFDRNLNNTKLKGSKRAIKHSKINTATPIPKRTNKQNPALIPILGNAVKVVEDALRIVARAKISYTSFGLLLIAFLFASVGYWHTLWHDVLKLIVTTLSIYCLVMGTLWNAIERNNLKAGLNALKATYNVETGQIYSEPYNCC